MYLRRRRHGCRASLVQADGFDVVVLEHAALRVAVIPARGAEIVELRDKRSDVDVLGRTPWPVRNASTQPAWTPDPGAAFLDGYGGGWQEMFPSCGDPSEWAGTTLGVHGEVTTLPWNWRIEREDDDVVSVVFDVETNRTPFRLTRRMTLHEGSRVLHVDERVTSLATEPLQVMWGHHPCFGAPFLEPGCHIETDAATIVTSARHHDPAMRLAPDRRSSWPHAIALDGGTVDLSHVPGPDARRHDWAYLTDFTSGWIALRRPAGGLGVALSWSKDVMPYLLMWQNFAGARSAPWFGRAYLLGLEPMSTFPASVEHGDALIDIAPGEERRFRLTATLFDGIAPVRAVDAHGVVA